jgi:acyl-coenzyme A thioesterase PaaI-like protein
VSGPASNHPHPDHALRELGIELGRETETSLSAHMPVTDAVRAPSGEPLLGPVATMVDMLGGIASLRACAPDRVATADMSLHLLPTGGTDRIDATMHIRRRGRHTLVVEVALTGASGLPAGLATLTFAVLPQPPGTPGLPLARPGPRPALEPRGVGARRFADSIGLRPVDADGMEIDVRPQVCNSLGALNGGVLTTTLDAAAARVAVAVLGRDAETVELQIAFLELGRTGPVRARAEAVGNLGVARDGGRVTLDATATDEGNDGELLARAWAVAVAS